MKEKKHAVFSISKSERWINCPNSAIEEAKLPDSESSVYAEEGKSIASLIDLAIKNRQMRGVKPNSSNWELKIDKIPNTYNQEVKENASSFIDWLGGVLKDASEYHSEYSLTVIPDKVYGTADIIAWDEVNNKIIIVDFKYGIYKYVPAFNNTQLGCYAIGALQEKKYIGRKWDYVETYIYQPRHEGNTLSSFEQYNWGISQLYSLLNAVTLAVYNAENGLADYKDGDWCNWCKFKPQCPKLGELVLANEKYMHNPKTLTVEQLSHIYSKSKEIKSFLKGVENRIIELKSHGWDIPGVEVVESVSNRKWEDETKVLQKNSSLSEPKVLSPAQVEKVVGKKTFIQEYESLLSPQVVYPKVVKKEDVKRKKLYDFSNRDAIKAILETLETETE